MEPFDPQSPAPPPGSRSLRVLVLASAGFGLALLVSPGLYLVAGVLGTVAGLPLGALSWLIAWCGMVAATLAMPVWMPGAGRWLLDVAGLTALDAEKRSRVLWIVVSVALVSGALLALALWPGAPAERPARWCYAGDLARGTLDLAVRAMGHGRAPAAIDCGAVPAPQWLAWLPLLVAAALALLLRRAHDELEQDERQRDAAAARQSFEARKAAASASPGEAPASAAAMAPVASVVVEWPVLPAPRPVSARTAAVLHARREAARRREPVRTDWSSPLRRWPVLGAALLCYLVGWALLLAGSEVPARVASALSPGVLRYSLDGWPVLGLWVSGWVGLIVGGSVVLVRRANAD
jgi:hypothetical protein